MVYIYIHIDTCTTGQLQQRLAQPLAGLTGMGGRSDSLQLGGHWSLSPTGAKLMRSRPGLGNACFLHCHRWIVKTCENPAIMSQIPFSQAAVSDFQALRGGFLNQTLCFLQRRHLHKRGSIPQARASIRNPMYVANLRCANIANSDQTFHL